MATHVRIVRGNIAPGNLATLLTALREKIVPQLEEIDGFEHVELWADDDGVRCELAAYFSACPVGLEQIDPLFQRLMGTAIDAGVQAEVQEFGRLRIAYPEPVAYVAPD